MYRSIVEGLRFIRKHPAIVYSLFLIVAITGIVLFNTYYALDAFQKNTDALLQSKAVLAEDMFRVLARDGLRDTAALQEKLIALRSYRDDGLGGMSVLMKPEGSDDFEVVASTDTEDIGVRTSDTLYTLAWAQDDGVAFLGDQDGERMWYVVKSVQDSDGRKAGLVSLQLSLGDHDRFVERTIQRSYLVAFVSLGIVLLLILNHVRSLRYAIRATHLEEVGKMKDDFISMASHELKSPLGIIRGYVETLEDSIRSKHLDDTLAEERQFLANISSSAERLNALVEDLLNVSRLEQDRLPIKSGPLPLQPLLDALASEFSMAAEKKGLELILHPYEDVTVMADADRVRQILINLLSNAVKYTPKGKVEVSVKEKDGAVIVTVADTGLGISAENLKNLFAKFYRVKNDATKNISGTGLGLWISREIARRMEGDLTVESIEGVGSHFTLTLKKS